MHKMVLNYNKPASKWQEILPIGNGSLGGMIWGTIPEEHIGLDEESMWSGYVTGLRIKGNKTVDISWENGIVTSSSIYG